MSSRSGNRAEVFLFLDKGYYHHCFSDHLLKYGFLRVETDPINVCHMCPESLNRLSLSENISRGI